MNLHTVIARLLAALLSIIQASSLRDRYYAQQEQLELLATAIDDIDRINSHSANPNPLIHTICARFRK
jgi:hypothetical protein